MNEILTIADPPRIQEIGYFIDQLPIPLGCRSVILEGRFVTGDGLNTREYDLIHWTPGTGSYRFYREIYSGTRRDKARLAVRFKGTVRVIFLNHRLYGQSGK